MRTIKRDIVGAFIFSNDGKILLGYSKVFKGKLVVPGGGMENNETEIEALKRELLEETGIDISNAHITRLKDIPIGESEKVLSNTAEKVLVKMRFHDFKVNLADNAESIDIKLDDDFINASWYTPKDLINAPLGSAVKATLRKLSFL